MTSTVGKEAIVAMCDEFYDRHFTEENIKFWCEMGGLPSRVYKDFYDCDLGAYVLPASVGGLDCPFSDRVTVVEHLTYRAGAMLPFVSDMLTGAILRSMREQSQSEIIEDYSLRKDGNVLFSEAFTEAGAGSDMQAIRTQVSSEDGKLFLDGTKTFVSAGQFAPRALVLARDPICGQADGGLSLWLVPLDCDGVQAAPMRTVGQEMLCPAVVTFEHVALDPDWQIKTEGKLNTMIKRQLALGRTLICATSLGLARAAMSDAVAYARQHKVKGVMLGSMPQVQEKLSDMLVKVKAMELFVGEAAEAADGTDVEEHTLKTTTMKYFVPKAATEVASEAMQIFGGIGYTDATRVSRIWRDCRGNQISQGSDEVMVHYIASSLMKTASEMQD